jgi:hypothetical protein
MRTFHQVVEVVEMLLLEELESAFAAYFKQSCHSNYSTDGTHLKDKGFHISAPLEEGNFSASNV